MMCTSSIKEGGGPRKNILSFFKDATFRLQDDSWKLIFLNIRLLGISKPVKAFII